MCGNFCTGDQYDQFHRVFTRRKICETDADEDDGEIRLRFTSPAGHDAGLLMKSLVLGLQGIQNTYGNDYIILNFKEV